MASSRTLLLLLCSCLILAFFPTFSRATLSAYYSFDGGQLGGLSGYCPNVVPLGSMSSSTTTSCKFGDCLPSGGTFNARTVKIFQGTDSSQLSISLWTTISSTSAGSYSLVRKLGMISIGYDVSCLLVLCTRTFSATYTFNAQRSVTVSIDSPFSSGNAYHIAAIYDSSAFCVYINGAAKCASSTSVFTETTSTDLVFGNSWPGTIDEVKIYDHALTSAELSALRNPTAPNDQPQLTLNIDGESFSSSLSVPALTNFTAVAGVVDAKRAFSGVTPSDPSLYSYEWQTLSTKCGIVDTSDSTGQSTLFKLLNVGSFSIRMCVSDGEVASEIVISAFVTASFPVLEKEAEPEIVIPEGAVNYPITVTASAIPPPAYQWQKLVTIEVNTTTNSTTNSTGAGKRDEEYHSFWMDKREIVNVTDFVDIDGATANTLLVNGTAADNNTVVRCIIFNGGGSVVSSNITVRVNAAPVVPPDGGGGGSGGDSSSDSTNITIIAAAAGGGGGLVVLCCLMLVMAALSWGWKRGRSPYRKLKQPDYAEIAYGDVKNDVVIPKRQADHYLTLERLIIAPDLRLAHAILQSARHGDLDVASRSLMRVLDAHGKGFNFIAGCISWEVAEASDEGTLFRSNSNATKLFSYYMKMIGLKYLWHVLVLSVHSLNDNANETFPETESEKGSSSNQQWFKPQGSRVGKYRLDTDDEEAAYSSISMDILGMSSMELDPEKLDEASDVTINTLELWLIAQKMFKLITASQKNIPRQLRMIMEHVHDEVGQRFGDTPKFRAIGAFYFLRLICPALLAPQAYGLLDDPAHQVAQRQLILVSKVLQNLANDTLPGAKEAYMEQLNQFIITNKPMLELFYSRIVEEAGKGKLVDSDVPLRVKNDGLIKLHTIIVNNLAMVEQALRDDGGDEDIIHALNYVLKEMGDLDGEGKNIADEDLGDLDL